MKAIISNNQLIEETCPYLGFIDDDGTAMSYPSDGNICHKCMPINTPNAQYQREYCLSQKHANCIVFKANTNQPMPKEMVIVKVNSKNGVRKLILSISLFTLLLTSIFLLLLSNQKLPILNEPTTNTTEPSMKFEKSPTIIMPTMTPTSIQTPTKPVPTETSTPLPLHFLETPIGIEKKLIVHKILEGETLIALAEKYSTTIDSIKEINVFAETLRANSIWIIPVGQSDVSEYPQLKAIIITEDGITLEDVALQYMVDSSVVSKLNDVPNDYLFHINEWVIIPTTNEGT